VWYIYFFWILLITPSVVQNTIYANTLISNNPAISLEEFDWKKIQLNAPAILIDLNGDGLKEKVYWHKGIYEDAISWSNQKDKELFRTNISPMGSGSEVTKFQYIQLSSIYASLLIFYKSGSVGYNKKITSNRLYALSFNLDDLTKATVQDLGYLFVNEVLPNLQFISTELTTSVIPAPPRQGGIILQFQDSGRGFFFNEEKGMWVLL